MSSEEDFGGLSDADGRTRHGPDVKKRRKLMRACDHCRKKKTKCDSTAQSGKTCSNCRANKWDCTFIEDAEKRGIPKRYVEELEKRCRLLEQLILRFAPFVDLEREVGPKFDRDTWASVKAAATSPEQAPRNRSHKRKKPPSPTDKSSSSPNSNKAADEIILRPPGFVESQSRNDSGSEESRSQDLNALVMDLEHGLKRMTIGTTENRFHGECSGISVIHAVARLKEEVEGIRVLDEHTPGVLPDYSKLTARSWFWRPSPWEYLSYNLPSPSEFKFPPEDLANSLIALCFTRALVIYPILHRPSFERDAKAGLHRRDLNFGKLYLLVCAVGSRFSTDPRVALRAPNEPGMDPEIQWRSAGWIFFSQVMALNRPLLQPALLVDLQMVALAALYLEGSGSPYATAWLLVGVGLRAAQDLGVHRESFFVSTSTFEGQMWRRVFWTLFAMERFCSSGLGRAMALGNEDIDTALPLEVDDEYFDEASLQWNQPHGKPSRISAFNHWVKLTGHMVLAAKRTLPSKLPPSNAGPAGRDLQSDLIAELDSPLTEWYNALPDHLAWDPSDTDDIHFEQTTCLRLIYHQVQTIIHQPFIPLLSGTAQTTLDRSPSLTICKHASQSVSRILDVRLKRGLEIPSSAE